MASNIESVRAWLRKCPLLDNTKYFRVDFIDDDPTCYAIYSSPSPINFKRDITGDVYPAAEQIINYYFGVSCAYGKDIRQNMENINALERLIAWMIEQNQDKNFPQIAEGKVITILPTLTPYPRAQGAESALYRISIQMKYRRF